MNIPEHLVPILTMIEPTIDWEKMSINEWVGHLLFLAPTTIKYLPMALLNGLQTYVILNQFPDKANDNGVNWHELTWDNWGYLLYKQLLKQW